MRAIACCAAGLTLLLSACAGAPDQAATAAPSAIGDAPAVSAAATTDAAADAQSAGVAADSLPQVDVNQLAATTPVYRCRDMLRRGSNVMVQRCMTEEDWKRFERQEAAEAREWVRMVQRNEHR